MPLLWLPTVTYSSERTKILTPILVAAHHQLTTIHAPTVVAVKQPIRIKHHFDVPLLWMMLTNPSESLLGIAL